MAPLQNNAHRTFGPIFQEIANLTSHSTALRLIRFYGGKRIVFPLRPKPSHRLSVVTGQPHFETLCYHFGGVQIEVPKGAIFRRRRQMAMMRGLVQVAGWSDRAVAAHFGVSRQYVNEVNQPRQAWIGIAPRESLQDFAPTFQLSLGLSSEQPHGMGMGSMLTRVEDGAVFFGKALRVLSGLRKLEVLVRSAKQDDGKIDRDEFRDIAVFGLVPILSDLGIDLFADFLPESDVGKAAFKGVVEAIESQGESDG